ncbi:MAG: hypothetical protein QM730_04050 [Anaerolineales bacterium]
MNHTRWNLPTPTPPKSNFVFENDLTHKHKTMTNQNTWMQDKGEGGQSDTTKQPKMYLRRRSNEPKKIRQYLRRRYISLQAKAKPTTEQHTLCAYTGCAGDAEALHYTKDLCKRATQSLEDLTIQFLIQAKTLKPHLCG